MAQEAEGCEAGEGCKASTEPPSSGAGALEMLPAWAAASLARRRGAQAEKNPKQEDFLSSGQGVNVSGPPRTQLQARRQAATRLRHSPASWWNSEGAAPGGARGSRGSRSCSAAAGALGWVALVRAGGVPSGCGAVTCT